MAMGRQLAKSQDISNKVSIVFNKRAQVAQQNFSQQLKDAYQTSGLTTVPKNVPNLWREWYDYAVDATQRSILFWDTLRQRGNAFVEHTAAGLPPLLHFDYETVVDGRKL